jgi:hypothetical protein
LLGGCFALSIGDGQYLCGSGGTCPAGFECGFDGHCYPSSALPPPSGDAGPGDVPVGADLPQDTDGILPFDTPSGQDQQGQDRLLDAPASTDGIRSDGVTPGDAVAADAKPVDVALADAPPDLPVVSTCQVDPFFGTDTFESTTLNARLWSLFGTPMGITSQQTGGQLHFTTPATTPSGAELDYMTLNGMDFREHRVFVQVVHSLNPTQDVVTQLVVQDANGAGIEIYTDAGDIIADFQDGSVALGQRAYDPSRDRFWQLRETGGQLFAETSPDAATWEVLGTAPARAFVTSAYVVLGVFAASNGVDAGTAVFDNYNVCP